MKEKYLYIILQTVKKTIYSILVLDTFSTLISKSCISITIKNVWLKIKNIFMISDKSNSYKFSCCITPILLK